MIINRKSYLRKTFIIFIIFNIFVLGAKPRVYAADAAVPVIPIAEAILAYIVAAGAGASYASSETDLGAFGNVTNYDEEVKTVALAWAKVASNEIKQAAYDAWNAAYTAGTQIQVPQSVINWVAGSDRIQKFLQTTTVQSFERDSGWIIGPMSHSNTLTSTIRFWPQGEGKLSVPNSRVFKISYNGSTYYASQIEVKFYWNGTLEIEYSSAIDATTYVLKPTTKWPYDPSITYPQKQITTTQAIIYTVEVLGSLPQVPWAELNKIYAKKATYTANFPTAIPAPMPKDFIIQGEGDQAKPVGFPIPKVTTKTDATTGTKTDVISVPIGETLVDVKTGEVVGDVTTAPGNPPLDWDSQPSERINWEPLKLGNVLTKKFPFSIPWDIGNQFAVFDVSPKPPVLKVDKTIPVFNTSMKFKFTIDFTIWDPVFVVVRWGLIVAFDLGMILSIRKFMPE